MKKKNVLALGIGQSNFLNQLYGDLIRKDDSITVDIDGFFDVSSQGGQDNSIYRKYLDFKITKIGTVQRYKSLFAFMRTAFFWQILYFELSQQKTLGEIKKIMLSYSWSKHIVENVILKADYDIFHFHYCNPENLKFVHFFPKESKIICTFWGSDLMRNPGVSNVFYVSKALSKADAITIQSRELAEMLYCKFGRELAEKTNIVQFTIHTGIYEKMDAFKGDDARIESFKQLNGIPPNRITISVGHNAFEANNHIAILESLVKLPSEAKNKISILLPLGYGRDGSYLQKLQSKVSQISDFPIILLDQYFGPDDTALLRLVSDIMIQMPITDALSGAMTEVLYAGNHVIAGSWLPYGLLKRNGIVFEQAESFDEIPELVLQYLSKRDTFLRMNQSNEAMIKKSLFPEKTTADWLRVFNRLFDQNKTAE